MHFNAHHGGLTERKLRQSGRRGFMARRPEAKAEAEAEVCPRVRSHCDALTSLFYVGACARLCGIDVRVQQVDAWLSAVNGQRRSRAV